MSYYRSHDFLNLKDITKADRRGIIENFRKLHGDKPVAKLKRAHINDIVAAKANIVDGRATTQPPPTASSRFSGCC